MRFRLRQKTASAAPSVTYDTSIGNGVDANGFASLPLHSGATYYFAGNGGNDANDGLTHATRLATVAAGITKLGTGLGDQLLLAEGSTFAEVIPFLTSKSGFSLTYPTVIQTYDPADPTNTAKYGRGDQRGARPILTGAQGQVSNNVAPPSYLVIRGLDFNPGNIAGVGMLFSAAEDGILIENNIFRYSSFSFDTTEDPTVAPTHQHVIFRNNASYGQWSSTNGITGGAYISGIATATIEDNVFYHNGWKIGASRDDLVANGGLVFGDGSANVFAHPWYLQGNTNGIARRNLVMDVTDTATARGDSDVNSNVFLRCPSGEGLGDGQSTTYRPLGVLFSASYNVMVAAIDLNSTAARGIGWTTFNGLPGSRIHHNLNIYSAVESGSNALLVGNSTAANQPSYMEFEDNVSVHWNLSGKTFYSGGGTFPAQCHSSYDRNIWDDPASGTNINRATPTFPNPYTETSLYTAAGAALGGVFTDYASLVSYAIAHPEAHVQRTISSLALAGYGISAPADVTAPTLSSASSTTTGASTATIGVTTNEATGVLYYEVTTSATPPHVSQIKFGMTASNVAGVASGSVAISSTGAKTFSLTSLSSGTYYAHFMHEDASGNKSVAATSSSFTI